MIGWLTKRAQNARVYMCIKEVKWDLEEADGPRRATLLLHAHRLRLEFMDEDKAGLSPSYFDDPSIYSRAELFEIYESLETIRNRMVYQYAQTQKSLARMGVVLPAYAVEHSRNVNRGLEIWMCTLGSGIATDRRDDVRRIWTLLSEGAPFLPQAIRGLREIAESIAAFAGASNSSDILDEATIPDLIAATKFVPTAFRTE